MSDAALGTITIRDRIPLTPEQGDIFVRAAIGGISVAECPTDLQWAVLTQVAAHLFGIDIDPASVVPLEAEEVAALVSDPATRRRIVQAIVTLELLEDPIRPALATHVRRFAQTLGVDEPMVTAAKHAARGQMALMYADIQRNSYYTEETAHEILHGHLWRLLRSKFAYSNIVPSRAIERKWASLADMPEGSWGRATAEFYRVHSFPVPGARRGIGEIGAHHDFVHVLADYPPDPEGEIDVFAFIAASMVDPKGFVQLVMTLGLFQNATITHVAAKKVVLATQGVLGTPGAAARFADGLNRGVQCKVDALGIDHFAVAAEPLDAIRERFGVIPRADTSRRGALDPLEVRAVPAQAPASGR